MSEVKDGGHLYPHCSNCRAILADLWRTRPDEPETWKVYIKCPWCGDKSFATEVKGGFHPGGYARTKQDDETDDIPSTVSPELDLFDQENMTVVFSVSKAPDGKPVYSR